MTESVISTLVKGEDIQAFTERLLPVMEGARLDVAAAAMLSLIVTNMLPTITSEQLAEVVTGTAGYLVTLLSGLTGEVEVVN